MSYATATFPDVSVFDGRLFAYGEDRRAVSIAHYRRVFGGIGIGLATVAAAGAIAGSVTMAAVWMVGTALSTNPRVHALASMGPAALAVANNDYPGRRRIADFLSSAPVRSAATSDLTRDAKPAVVAAPAPVVIASPPKTLASAPAEKARPPAKFAAAPANNVPLPPKRVVARADRVPLPLPRPADAPRMQAKPEIARAPATPTAPKAALAVSPPPTWQQRPSPRPHDDSISLPGPASRTAVYDIVSHTVYLPNGERLEAHSGLGKRLDNPRYVSEKDRGPTPPNVYELALRKQLFHGVRAIRLNPVDDKKMFGRDGMLAHSYMLGPSGQSFGCVSFKDYPQFLSAYLNGEIDRLVVVPHLDGKAVPVRARRRPSDRYAFNDR